VLTVQSEGRVITWREDGNIFKSDIAINRKFISRSGLSFQHRYARSRNNSTVRVGKGAADGSPKFLRKGSGVQKRTRHQQREQAHNHFADAGAGI
jgi:hypothetical protein